MIKVLFIPLLACGLAGCFTSCDNSDEDVSSCWVEGSYFICQNGNKTDSCRLNYFEPCGDAEFFISDTLCKDEKFDLSLCGVGLIEKNVLSSSVVGGYEFLDCEYKHSLNISTNVAKKAEMTFSYIGQEVWHNGRCIADSNLKLQLEVADSLALPLTAEDMKPVEPQTKEWVECIKKRYRLNLEVSAIATDGSKVGSVICHYDVAENNKLSFYVYPYETDVIYDDNGMIIEILWPHDMWSTD